jgi:hypothetical protein
VRAVAAAIAETEASGGTLTLEWFKLIVTTVPVLLAVVPVVWGLASALLVGGRGRGPRPSDSPLRVVEFGATPHAGTSEASPRRARYVLLALIGALMSLLLGLALLTGNEIRLVSEGQDPAEVDPVPTGYTAIAIACGALVALWASRLALLAERQSVGEPAASHEASLVVDADKHAAVERCQAAFVEFGALHAKQAAVTVEVAGEGSGVLFTARRRRHEFVALEVVASGTRHTSVRIRSGSYVPRFWTRRFRSDVRWLAERVLS